MTDRFQTLTDLLDTDGRKLHALLLRLTLREDVAEDLMQDLFIHLSQSNSFARARKPAAFAYRTALNLGIDWRRRSRRREAWALSDDVPRASDQSPLTAAIDTEAVEQILDATTNLSAIRRQIFLLRHLQEDSFTAIAEQVHKTPKQARSLYYKALKQLRAMLNTHSHSAGGRDSNDGSD